jgi:uncharacterized protein YbjT (DUF2867 family)
MILVTGAGGTVGSEVLKQLRQQGAQVRAAFHSSDKAKRAKSQGIDVTTLDFADRKSIATALEGVDKLFLLGPTAPNQVELENNVVAEAKNAGIKHIVKLSVLDAANERLTFAQWHRAVEKNIEDSGIPYTFLRPTSFMQNTINYYLPTIQTDGAFYLPEGEAKTSLVDVRDIAAVAVKALTDSGHERKAYDLTGPETLTNHEVAEKLSAAVGREIRYVNIPPDAFREGALKTGIPDFYVDALLDLHRFIAAGGSEYISPDVERVLGRKPHTFDQFARDHVDIFRAQRSAAS